MSVQAVAGTDEVAAFAEAVATAVDRTLLPPEPWRPGTVQDDRSPALSDALAAMGWLDLADDPALLPLAGPAALELGRRLAPLADVDALLGGSPRAGGLVRYGARRAVTLQPADRVADGGAANGALFAIDASEPVAYGDALGVHRVLASSPAGEVGATAIAAWTAAGTGYLAGLADWALARARPR